MSNEGVVYVVDDDDAVRDALGMLFRAAGLPVEPFASAEDFLECATLKDRSCLVLDIRMPEMTGTVLHEKLIERGVNIPVIFVTGHGDIPMAVDAVKRGAFDFIEKPFDDLELLGRVRKALSRPTRELPGGQSGSSPAPPATATIGNLSAREREVLDLVLAGKPSREIAIELFISVKTVDFHRARIMHKLHVRSVAELFRLCLATPGRATG